MIETLLFGATCGVVGWVAGYVMGRRDGERHLKAAEQETEYWHEEYFANAFKFQSNSMELASTKFTIKDMADSQARLADALAAKNERLERIIAKGRESKSGSAQHLARIAAGEA
jgi:hypothetical protein